MGVGYDKRCAVEAKVECWLEAVDNGNKAAHIYDEHVMAEVLTFVVNDFQPVLRDFYLWCKKTVEAEAR